MADNEKYYYGKGNVKGQSGGVVTTFLQGLINDNKIDRQVFFKVRSYVLGNKVKT